MDDKHTRPAIEVGTKKEPVLVPPAAPSMSPEECVKAWIDTQNFGEQRFQSPQDLIPQLEVTSWGQVPYILKRALDENVKIDFVCSGESRADAELQEIRRFLQGVHKEGLSKALTALEEKLKSCGTFDPSQVPPAGTITDAKAWIAAHGLTAPPGSTFCVTDILVAPKSASSGDLEQFKQRSITSLQEHQSSKRPLAVLLPEAADVQTAVAATIRELLQKESGLQGVEKTAVVWRPEASDPSKLLEESLADFLSVQAQAAVPPNTTITVLPPEPPASGQEPSKPSAEDNSETVDSVLLDLGVNPDTSMATGTTDPVPTSEGSKPTSPDHADPADTQQKKPGDASAAGDGSTTKDSATKQSEPQPAPSSKEEEEAHPSSTGRTSPRPPMARKKTAGQLELCYPSHSYTQRGQGNSPEDGNQDRIGTKVTEKAIFLAVSDGFSGASDSVVGARLLTDWALTAAEDIFSKDIGIPSAQDFAKQLEAVLLKGMRDQMKKSCSAKTAHDQYLAQNFSATILIGVVTPTWSAVIGAGGGCYSFGEDQIRSISDQYNAQPAYLYRRLLMTPSSGVDKVGLKVFAETQTKDTPSLAIFSHGTIPLMPAVNGTALKEAVKSDNGLEVLFKPLAEANDNDFSVVVVHRDGSKLLPDVWQNFSNGNRLAFRKPQQAKRS